MRIVLGSQDDVIKAKDNLVFLSQNFSELKDCTIQIINELAHQIPVAIFEQQTEDFFEELCYWRMLNANNLIANILATIHYIGFKFQFEYFTKWEMKQKKYRKLFYLLITS